MLRILLLLLIPFTGFSQFTFEDTLKGSITPERAWWDNRVENEQAWRVSIDTIKAHESKNTRFTKKI